MRIYRPGEKAYPELSDILLKQWRAVPTSRDGKLEYHPCRVKLKDGRILDCVYIIPAQAYIEHWGIWPEDDKGKLHINVLEVIEIMNSPHRLPPNIASRIYKAGESGMGYCIFTLVFDDGTEKVYVTGNAVDFVKLPDGKSSTNIVDVFPHKGRGELAADGLEYYWCLFGTGKSRNEISYYTDKAQ
jgi:hypothetical protein